jgi:uncharacterized membrane protein
MSQLPILIIGGTGKTGARVNAILQALGIATRPVSRSAAIPFDWTRPQTWPAALHGMSRAYVTYQPDLAVEGSTEAGLSRLAREKGLQQVVLLSGRGEPGAQRAEAALQASGVPWSIVRASWFNQNFSEGYGNHRTPVRAVHRCPRRAQQRRHARRRTGARPRRPRLFRLCPQNRGDRRLEGTIMIQPLITGLLWFSAIGCGLLAGIYFAFSTFIMTALGRIGPAPGITAMNAINVTIEQSLFMPIFLGTTLTSLVLAVFAMLRWGEPGATAMAAAGLLYFLGMFICTMAFNVPLNNALAAFDPASAEAVSVWARYLTDWIWWNHVRTISSTAACGLFIAAIAAR